MIIRALDFETTGIPTDDDPHAIVEWGYSDLPARDYASQLVNPARPIPFDAMAVHHITDEMVTDKSPFSPAMIDGADIYVAHNAAYEQQFYKTEKPWICTYKVASVYGQTCRRTPCNTCDTRSPYQST